MDSQSAKRSSESVGAPQDAGIGYSSPLVHDGQQIAGGALTPLEDLQIIDQRLTKLVARWKLKRGGVVDNNVSGARRLIERAYEVLGGDLQLGPKAVAAYKKVQNNLERRYANAIDKIDILIEGLEPFQIARSSTGRTTRQAIGQASAMSKARNDVIDAVEDFQVYFSKLVEQLVRIRKAMG